MERSALEVETEKKKENEMVGICRRSWKESKKLWEITAPAMLSLVAQFSFEFVSTAFIGHVGELELAAVSFVHNVIEGFVYGIMVCQKNIYVYILLLLLSLYTNVSVYFFCLLVDWKC